MVEWYTYTDFKNSYLEANSCHNIFSGFRALIVWNIWVQFIGDVAAAHMDKISDTFSKDLMLENLRLHSNRNTWANETGRTLKLVDDFTTRCPFVIRSKTYKCFGNKQRYNLHFKFWQTLGYLNIQLTNFTNKKQPLDVSVKYCENLDCAKDREFFGDPSVLVCGDDIEDELLLLDNEFFFSFPPPCEGDNGVMFERIAGVSWIRIVM